MKPFRTIVTVISMLAACLPLWANAQSPKAAGMPQSFDEVGVVDHINLEDQKLVVGDSTYAIGNTVPVVLPSGGVTNVGALRKGTRVGLSIGSSPQGWPRITRVWVLPKDFVLPEQEN